MFKLKKDKKIHIYIIIFLIIGGIFTIISTYASQSYIGNALDKLNKKIQKTAEIDKIFDGKANIENVYKLSLGLVKDNKTKTANNTLNQINFLLPNNGNQTVSKEDVLNILYDSNRKFKKAIDRIGSGVSKDSIGSEISEDSISNSYIKFSKVLNCKKEKNKKEDSISKDEKDCIQLWAKSNYDIFSQGNENIINFNLDNYGEELFLNGSIEDSEYDLMVDIDRIGSLLFNSFKAPTETLFYKLPTIKGNNTSNTNGNTAGSSSTIDNLLQQIANGQGGLINTDYTVGSTGGTTIGEITTIKTGSIYTITGTTSGTTSSDIQKFINQTNAKNESTTTNTLIQGNTCIEGITENITTTNIVPTYTETEIIKYLSGLDYEIQQLQINLEYQQTPEISTPVSLSGENSPATNELLENIIGGMFDSGAIESCLQKCNGLSTTDKVICQIQCLCNKVSFPKFSNPKLQDMNDSVILKFCMIPVQKNNVSKASDIYSRDEMLTRIKGLLENLINGGEMVKYYRTKEYLENPIGNIKRTKIFSFNIDFTTKPLFSNTPTKAEKDKAKAYVRKFTSTIGNKNESPALDVNKYIIVSDYVKDKAYKEFGAELKDIRANYDEAIANKKNSVVNQEVLKEEQTHIDKKTVEISETILEYLSANNIFWGDTIEVLNQLNQDVYYLKNSSKFTEKN